MVVHARASIPARLWPWLLLAFVAVYVAAHWATRVVPDSLGGQAEAPARAFMDFDIYLTGARQLAAGNSVYAPTENLPLAFSAKRLGRGPSGSAGVTAAPDPRARARVE